jgi:8-oxo-dGTP pyrophosphatase MutT (NUDIX family)
MLKFSHTIADRGDNFRLDIYTESFNEIKPETVTQVYGLITNDKGEFLVVWHKRGAWILPGGGVEAGENWIQTLNREAYEEAAIYLQQESIKEAYYQEIFKQQPDGTWLREGVQLRYSAKLKSADTFQVDPDEDIVEIKWIDINDLGKYLDWGNTVGLIQEIVRS